MPTIPDQIPKIKYNVPMSLWFVDKSHFLIISNCMSDESNKL